MHFFRLGVSMENLIEKIQKKKRKINHPLKSHNYWKNTELLNKTENYCKKPVIFKKPSKTLVKTAIYSYLLVYTVLYTQHKGAAGTGQAP